MANRERFTSRLTLSPGCKISTCSQLKRVFLGKATAYFGKISL